MRITLHKNFKKDYKKLSKKQKEKVSKILDLFEKNPFDERLYNHPLKGSLLGMRSISVSGDLRIIFIEKKEYLEVIFLRVGSHAQIY